MALISKTGIINGNAIQPEHLTRIIDALNESGSATIIATGSFTGSFKGDGSQINGLVSSSYALTASYALNSSGLGAIAQTATGSVSASVGISTNSFTVVSGSTTLLNVKSNGGFSAGIGNTTQLLGDIALGTFNLAGAKKVDFYSVGGVYYNASLKTMYVTGDVTTYAASGSTISWMHSNNYALYTSTVASTPSYNGTYTSIVITSDPSGGVNDTFLYDYGYLVTEKNTDAYPAGRLAHGAINIAWGRRSHAEGYYTQALGRTAHSEGHITVANGVGSHSEGFNTYANGQGSHAEGYLVSSSANYSHAEGQSTNSTGVGSHAEGLTTISAGSYSHAEGQSTVSVGTYSHAEGIGTVASGSGQTAAGKYNTHGNTTSLVVIGNGSSDSVRGDLALFNSQSIQFTVPLTGSIISGSFVGNGASITGVVSASYAATASYMIGSITSASYAATASYVVGSIASASYSQTAETSSFINVINTSNASNYYIVGINSDNGAQNPEQLYNFGGLTYNPDSNTLSVGGGVMVAGQFQGQATSAISSSYAVSSSYARNSLSASFAATASRAITATTATSANQLVSVNRSVTEFQTTDATPYVQNLFVGDPTARYIKAIVIGNSNSGSLGGEFTKFYDVNSAGSGTTQLSSTGTLADNIPGTPTFSISGVAQWTATGIFGVTIDWRVIIEYSDYATGF